MNKEEPINDNYPANEARFQPVHAPCVTTWGRDSSKVDHCARGKTVLKEDPSTDSTQAHDDLRVRRLIEEMQHPLILTPHCIAISDMPGRPYTDRSGHESRVISISR